MALKLKWQWRKWLSSRLPASRSYSNALLGVAFVGAILALFITNLPQSPGAEALIKGDGQLLYGQSSASQNQIPKYRSWTNSTNTFGSELSLPSLGADVHDIQTASAPTRDETIAAIQKQDLFSNQLQVYTWNGASWTFGFQATIGYNSSAPRFDVAYDEVTGKGFVIYSRNTGTTSELGYRTWDGSTWSSEVLLTSARTDGNVGYVKALTRPGTDEIAVIWADDSNMDLTANYFDMSAGTWSGEPAAALSTNIARNGNGTSINSDFADLAFESSSGALVVCWGDEDVADLKCSKRTAGTGGTWGAVQTYTSFAVNPTDMKMAAEPGTNYIAYNNAQDDDTARSVEAAIWNGTTWGNITNYDTSINSTGGSTTNVSVNWVVSGGQSRVIATYDDSLSAAIDWTVFNKNTSTWTIQSDITTSPAPGDFDDQMHLMRRNPHNSSELMFFIRDFGSDLLAKKITFDGTTITWTSVEPGGVVLETDMQSPATSQGWSADFAYYNYVNVIDGTVNVTANTHDGSAPNTVFINDQTGYSFYRDSTGACVYSKTTNGGDTWGAAVSVAASTCLHVNIWYDQWTPGDTSGTYIYIVATRLPSAGVGDLVYNRLDTTNDTFQTGTAVTITNAPGPAKTNEFRSDDNYAAISKGTDGQVYVGIQDSGTVGDQSYVLKCATSCTTASNWSDTNAGLPEHPDAQARNNATLLLPQPNGDMIMIAGDGTNNTVRSKIYTASTSTWAGSWTDIDTSATFNNTYAGNNISAVVDKKNFDVYLAFTQDAATLGTDDDIRTALFSSGAWTDKTDVLTNDSKGIIQPQLAMDQNTGDVYVAYIARTTPATATTANVYWKKSTNSMTSWGSEQGTLNTSPNDLWGLRLNYISDERIYAVWTDSISTSSSPRLLRGDTIANLTPPTYAQQSYRLFANSNATDVGASLAAVDTGASLPATGSAFRARVVMGVGSGDLGAGRDSFKLQYAGKGAGTCAAPSGTPSSYTDVTAGTSLAFYDNATPADGAGLTPNGNDPTHSTNQSYEELNPFTSVTAIAAGQTGMWDFALYDNGAPDTTTYCLRIVKDSGTALGTYTQYPEITTAAPGGAAPDSPSSLAQKKTNDTAIATGDWTNEASVKFTATASDSDASDTLQLCVEKKPIGVAFTNTEDTCGTGVSYSGSPVSVNVTIGSHSEDEYHWQARVKDAGGLYSSWVSYGGNAESARDYGVDTTAPTGGTVYDGSSAGVDAAFSTTSLTSLSANWSGISANISGLSRYDYSIGTTPGGTEVRGWTNNGTTASVTATGLSLHTSQKYYVNVRAVDAAGNVQSGISSDGQMVLPSLSFGLSSNTLSFNNLNAGNNYTDTQSADVTTSTNAYGGYAVWAYATGNLTSGAFSIPGFSGGSYGSPDTWLMGDTGWGYTSSDTLVQGVNKFQGAPCLGGSTYASPGCYAPFSLAQPGDVVADHDPVASGVSIDNDTYTITYRVTAPANQAARRYSANVVYSVVPVY